MRARGRGSARELMRDRERKDEGAHMQLGKCEPKGARAQEGRRAPTSERERMSEREHMHKREQVVMHLGERTSTIGCEPKQRGKQRGHQKGELEREMTEAPEPVAAAWASCASGGSDVRVRVPPKPPGDVGLAYYYPGDHASASIARRKEQRIRQFDRWLSNGRPAADRPTVRDPRLKPGEHHPTFEDDPMYAYVAPEAAASDQRPAAAAARGRSRSQDVRARMGRPSSAWPSSRPWQ